MIVNQSKTLEFLIFFFPLSLGYLKIQPLEISITFTCQGTSYCQSQDSKLLGCQLDSLGTNYNHKEDGSFVSTEGKKKRKIKLIFSSPFTLDF